MIRSNYTPEFKAKLVLEVLQGERELGEIAAENGVNPNLLRNWKKEFISKASRVFDEKRQNKKAQRREEELEEKQTQMLKTIGQLTLERDYLQGCFRRQGLPVPRMHSD